MSTTYRKLTQFGVLVFVALGLLGAAELIYGSSDGGINVPIDFWGQVVDQTGAPISGVRVEYSYTTTSIAFAWGVSRDTRKVTVTDKDGSFSARGLRGTCLNVNSLSKDGYVSSNRFPTSGMIYNYAGHTSEPKFVPKQNQPVAFMLLRKEVAEALIPYNSRLHLPGNGIPVRFNLGTGRQDPKGELQFTLHRDPSVYVSGQLKWEVKVEVLGGGIQEMDEKNITFYLAPISGYHSEGVIWTTNPRGSVFIKTAQGRYCRLRIEIYPNDEGDFGRCFFEGYLNPTGSRNLEYLQELPPNHTIGG